MRPIKIAASILSADFARLGDQVIEAIDAHADFIHVDVMDGHFVPNLTVGPLVVSAIKPLVSSRGVPLDVHLMIEEPDRYIADFIKAGADYLTVHLEASVHLHRTIHWIKDSGAKAGVSLNPATPIGSLDYILPDLDLVLLMSVNPGFGGQGFIPQILAKIKALKGLLAELGFPVLIEVDGGIKYENAKEVADAGADILVMGSAFFNSGDYQALTAKLRDLFIAR